MNPVSKYHPLAHYKWGDNCDGWNLVDEAMLSVKQERMPPGTAEQLHYHKESGQFFFILSGAATIITDDKRVTLGTGQGFYIRPGCIHSIENSTAKDVEFLLCSQPPTKTDRINCG
ncbi:MAG TPA: cupin domain-containing protein [Chitinophagaceae bacterium]|nr:cupin domain-containing protein [Chitinophagaceae bacterium]